MEITAWKSLHHISHVSLAHFSRLLPLVLESAPLLPKMGPPAWIQGNVEVLILITNLNFCLNHSSPSNSFPLIGHAYIHALAPIEKLLECKEKYGDIFRLDYGHIPTVWLCNYEQITSALKQDALQHRPHHYVPGMVGIWWELVLANYKFAYWYLTIWPT